MKRKGNKVAGEESRVEFIAAGRVEKPVGSSKT
jgi:hypothetical protein